MARQEEQSILRAQIAPYLMASPGATAAEIAGALGVSKKRVNAQLYRHDEFQSDGAKRPRWTVVASAPTARPRKKPIAATKKPIAKRAPTKKPSAKRTAPKKSVAKRVAPKKAAVKHAARTSHATTTSLTLEREVVRSRLNGSSVRDLVVEFGLLRSQVLRILDRDDRTRLSRTSRLGERDAEIVEGCLAGATLQELVEDFSLSKLRIAQILKMDPRTSDLVLDRRNGRLRQLDTAIIEGRLAGAEVADLAREFKLTQKRVREVLESDERTRGLAARRPLSARDEFLIAMRVDGRTLRDIAAELNLTHERVRQILNKHGHALREAVQSRQQALIEAVSVGLAEGKSISDIASSLGVPTGQVESLLAPRTDDARTETGRLRSHSADLATERVKAFLCENPGLTLEEVAEATGCSTSFVRRSCPSLARRLTVDGRAGSEKVWSDEQILEVIRRAATYEYPITVKQFEHLRSIGEIAAPSAPLVYTRFGGWRAACEAAGVESGETLRDSYESRWTDADLLRFAGQFLADESSDGTFGGFEIWLSLDVDRPSAPTMRNRLGRWSDIKRAALTADWFKDMLREQR